MTKSRENADISKTMNQVVFFLNFPIEHIKDYNSKTKMCRFDKSNLRILEKSTISQKSQKYYNCYNGFFAQLFHCSCVVRSE